LSDAVAAAARRPFARFEQGSLQVTHRSRNLLVACSAFVLAMFGTARAAVPAPSPVAPNAIDLGPLDALSAGTPITLTIAMRLSDESAGNGYNPAVGVGTMDAANFAEALRAVY
jgi:hypothetical protein